MIKFADERKYVLDLLEEYQRPYTYSSRRPYACPHYNECVCLEKVYYHLTNGLQINSGAFFLASRHVLEWTDRLPASCLALGLSKLGKRQELIEKF